MQLSDWQTDIPLAPFTTYKIGGPADYFFQASTTQQLIDAIALARQEHIPYFILGTGANILIQDGGFRGVVIHNQTNHITLNNTSLTADSGAIIAELIELTAKSGLSGLEHFAGIPSSVGGAMRQNLHFLSPDRQSTLFIESVVESAEILTGSGQRTVVGRDYFQFGYDDSILHHTTDIVLSTTFTLSHKTESEIRSQISANLEWRSAKQPALTQFPSCGSVFKKVEGVGVGRLIDQAGLKGKRIGGAQISEMHANFIVNLGGATSKDVLDLIRLAQVTVKERFGYDIETEIGVIGEVA